MKTIRTFIAIFISLFLVTATTACNDQTDDNSGSVDVNKVTFTDETLEYTGEPLAITVKNLPGGVKVDYTYSLNGEEVSQMIEIGVYDVTAVIKDNKTGKELRTLTAKLTIKEREVYDEIPDDLESNIELTYGTTYKSFVKNPDNENELIAAGIQIWATEKIYFVLGGQNKPLNFLELDKNSVSGVKLVDNTVVIEKAGSYDVIMTFPEGSLVPLILVREGTDSGQFYFRGSMNDYQTSDEYLFNVDEETNTASYEITLALNDTFKIANYYYSVEFNYNPYFKYLNNFTVGGEFNTDPKVVVAGNYKFVIDLETKALTVYCDGVKLEEDRTPNLYLRGSMNNWEAVTKLTRTTEGNNLIASIETELAVGDEFKIADDSYDVQFDYNSFSHGSSHFEASTDGYNNVKVKVAGLYKITINLTTKAVTVVVDGVTLFENKVASSGGGGGTTDTPSVPSGTDLYLRGSVNNWDTSTKLTIKDNVAFITYEFESGDIFKIADASWTNSCTFGYPYFAAGTGYFSEGTEYGNVVVDQAGTYEISLNLSDYTMTVKKDGEVIIAGSSSNPGGNGGSTEPTTIDLYLRGSMNEWGTANKLTVNGDIASITLSLAVNAQFKIANADWTFEFNSSHLKGLSQFGSIDTQNILVKEAGEYTFEINLKTNEIKVSKDGEVLSPEQPEQPEQPTEGQITLYLKPNSNWVQSDAWFAVYYWNGSTNGWTKMTDSDSDGIYEATIDLAACTNGVIFCRMNPASQTLDWSNKWDQTSDLKYSAPNNLFTVAADAWNNANGTWSNKN